MTEGSDTGQLIATLSAGAVALDLHVADERLEALAVYHQLLRKWNARMNLVGPGSDDEWLARHVLDSAAILRSCTPTGRLLDVGSGAGLPGIVLAILCPQLTVELIEPTRKRASFLRHCVAALNLTQVSVHNQRLEQVPSRPGADWAVSRAVWPPEVWLPIAAERIGPGGVVLVLSGHPVAVPTGFEHWTVTVDAFTLPIIGTSRCVTAFQAPAA